MKYNYFNFKKFGDQFLLTNDFGKFVFLSPEEFKAFVAKDFSEKTELYGKLLSSKMIFEGSKLEYSMLNRFDIRELKGHVNNATSLHIFVVTTKCNMRCVYCQANNGRVQPDQMMSDETAEKAVDIALQSPSTYLSFEFQGGEPLLNFECIKHIVEYTESNNKTHIISFNLVSNLTLLTDEMIDFFVEHKFSISTSLDGNEIIHNNNRTFPDGSGSYKYVKTAVSRIRSAGLNIGAIQTTTKASLPYSKDIVNAYAEMGFKSIFIRPLTPLGKAAMNWDNIGYTPDEFLQFYSDALNEVIHLNKLGVEMREEHASILLNRINGRYVNYMELRSPCGAGIGQLAYYADGNVFTCDEARMLYEMGDSSFQLGNVKESKFADIIDNSICKTVCASSILETIPSCSDCVYQPYCGTCPIVNYSLTGDIIEKQPRGYRCKVYSGMLDCLFSIYKNSDSDTISIINSWC